MAFALGVTACVMAAKVAMHVELETRFIVPLAQRPDHPEKVEPAPATADKVIIVLKTKFDVHAPGHMIPAGLEVTVPVPVPALANVRAACPAGASACPMRDLTPEISDALTTPVVTKSNRKLAASATRPDRALTALTSFAPTARVLSTSPNKKPIDADA